jgi:hypothetical protein
MVMLQERFPGLQPSALSLPGGTTAYRLSAPAVQGERAFKWAELRLPAGFPEHVRAFVQLSPDAVLRIPHLDSAGVLCLDGDPGPGMGYSAEERILFLLNSYLEDFLKPWLAGDLDGAFEAEALNYWAIEVARARSKNDPVRSVWTIDSPPAKATVREGVLLIPSRIVIAADEANRMTNRLAQSIGSKQRIGVLVADVPISHALTPTTWPKTNVQLDRLLKARLSDADYAKLYSNLGRRGRGKHGVVVMRSVGTAFAYLLPHGPATVVDVGKSKKTFPPLQKILPLATSRLDPCWIVGRDQHPEVEHRQARHVLVIGAGALGGAVTDHLAKAGVGKISLIDPDTMSAPNVGRHLLGAEAIGEKKAAALAQRINLAYPMTLVVPYAKCMGDWLKDKSLADVHVVLDLTGEPDVRQQTESARKIHPCPLLIGWMEPYVAAAHACSLPAGHAWLKNLIDPMHELQAVEWPSEVIQREPGCSSQFQSYTAVAAEHAVALIAESALEMIDARGQPTHPSVRSWVRGQQYLDAHWAGLKHRQWAQPARGLDGVILSRPFS